MLSVLEHLSSDELGGRYTLSDDIQRSADFISKLYQESGVAPVGDSYRSEFTLAIGIEEKTPTVLEVAKSKQSKRSKPVDAAAITPIIGSGSGRVEAPVVFVGYGLEASGEDDSPAYDDLAGVDVKDKIALVLAEAPSRPNMRSFFTAASAVVIEHAARIAELQKGEDDEALRKAHVALRRALADLAEPYLRGVPMPEAYLQPPVDLREPVSFNSLSRPLLVHGATLPGPQFDGGQTRTTRKIARLVAAGAKGVIVVTGPRTYPTAAQREEDPLPPAKGGRPGRSSKGEIPVVKMKWKAADEVFRIGGKKLSALQKKIDTKLQPASRELKHRAVLATDLQVVEKNVPNLLATIPGTESPGEIVLVGAHYDHIGTDAEGRGHCNADGEDAICNGADDNGSGTAVVVEMARALAEGGFAPKRTVVFALFAGEELGLLGSKAMAAQLPDTAPFKDGNIVAMINIDMVGRLRPQMGLAVGGVGSSSGWMPMLDTIDSRQMPIMFDSSVTTRSDHAAFYEQDIPVLFFFTHVHDDYHRPGDEMADINREGLTKVAEYVLDVTRAAIDHEPGALPFTAPADAGAGGLVGALPGDNPATIVKRIGFADVPATTPANEPAAATPTSDTPDTPAAAASTP